MTGRLEGKVALITGAGSVGPGWGNGRSAAVLFAREGARIAAADIKRSLLEPTVSMVQSEHGDIAAFNADVTDADQVEKLVADVLGRFGRIDVLVNNVGGSRSGGPVELSVADWQSQLDFNLTSTFLTCKFVLPAMKQQGPARS